MLDLNSGLIVLIVASVTFMTRAAPFMLFHGKHTTPQYILYLGRVLPPAVMGMLVVYCFKAIAPLSYPFALPELIAAAVVILLHVWKGKTLLSIGGGTVTYMLLVQLVFV